MKRVTVLSLCMLLAMVGVASATVMPGVDTVTAGGLTLTSTVDTTSYPGYDVVDFYLTGLPTGMTGLQIVQGEWSAVGGTFYVASKAATSSTFQSDSAWVGMDAPGAVPYSAVNMGTPIGAAMWNRDGGTTHNSSFILGGWDDGGTFGDAITAGSNRTTTGGATNSDGWAMNLVAEMVVTDSTTKILCNCDATFPGEVNGFNYLPSGTTVTTDFATPTTPEPSTIALLGCGLFGLLAYAWRKRK